MNDEEIIYGSDGSHMMESLQQSSPSPTEYTSPAEQVKIDNSVGAADDDNAPGSATNNASAEGDDKHPNANGDGTENERQTLGQRLQARLDSFARDDGTAAAPTTSERAGLPDQQNVNEEASRRRRNSPERTNTRRSASTTGPSLTQPPPRSYRLRTRDQKRPRRQERPPPNAFAIEVQQFEQQHAYPGAYSVPGMIGNAPDIGDHPASQSSSSKEDSVNGTGRFCNLPRRKLLWLSIGIIVVIVFTIVATVVAASSNSSVTESMSDDSLDDTTNFTASLDKRFSKWLPFVKELSDDKTVFNNPESPQRKALHWLLYEDSLSNAAADATYITESLSDIIKIRYLLALFYFATSGGGSAEANNGSWQNMYNFLSPSLHECEWTGFPRNDGVNSRQGVICNDDLEVTGIVVEGNGLHGTLPEELQSIKHFEVLRVKNNELVGHAPSFARLKVLDLSGNQFSGSVERILSRYLIELNVSHNLFGGSILQDLIPTPGESSLVSLFKNHDNLEVLDLSNCSFSGGIVNTNIEELTGLRTMRLDNNLFSGSLPSGLKFLTALSVFSASGNQLSGIALDSLSLTLEHLDFSNNLVVSSIPESIGRLSQLKDLSLSNNEISGTLPSTLAELTLLRTLDVSENHLEGSLPQEFANFEKLEDLILHGNLLSGTIPEELALLPSLDHAIFHDNNFSGDIGFLCFPDNSSRTVTADCLGESPRVFCSASCCDCSGG